MIASLYDNGRVGNPKEDFSDVDDYARHLAARPEKVARLFLEGLIDRAGKKRLARLFDIALDPELQEEA